MYAHGCEHTGAGCVNLTLCDISELGCYANSRKKTEQCEKNIPVLRVCLCDLKTNAAHRYVFSV
jgi:hypothetical protein